MLFESYSDNETLSIAMKIAENTKKGSIITLDGDLGVGKTVFSNGFAKGIGIEEPLSSPTFSVVNTYKIRDLYLYHFDVYRIEDVDELFEIGFYEYIDDEDAICLIEWGSQILDVLPKDTIKITISKDLSKGLSYRLIDVQGDIYENTCDR